jgi:hypothetical protein
LGAPPAFGAPWWRSLTSVITLHAKVQRWRQQEPQQISWFEDNLYDDGDSNSPYPFDDSPAYSGIEDSYHPGNISWFENNPYDDGNSDNPCHFGDSPASSGVEDGYHPEDISWFKDNLCDDRDSSNPYHFDVSPASSCVEDGGHDHLSVPGFITMHPHQDRANIIATPSRAPLRHRAHHPASFNALSQHSSHHSSLSSRALLSRCDAHGNQRPYPDGIDSSLANHSFYHPVVVVVVVAVAVAVVVVAA